MNDGPEHTPSPAKTGSSAEHASSSSAEETLPEALARMPEDRLVDADVRVDLRAGREPFQRIMAARRSLPPGGVLRVRAIFEPVPLYRVMAKQGLEHWTERLGEEDWRVWFYEPGVLGSCTENPAGPSGEDQGFEEGAADEARTGAGGMADEIVLDVRGLEPPEPMVRTLEALEDLPAGATLLQVNARVPRFLLPHLEERGYVWEIDERADDEVRLRIRRA